jgi:hypothetical protein
MAVPIYCNHFDIAVRLLQGRSYENSYLGQREAMDHRFAFEASERWGRIETAK